VSWDRKKGRYTTLTNERKIGQGALWEINSFAEIRVECRYKITVIEAIAVSVLR
jgi:hypothetical protein